MNPPGPYFFVIDNGISVPVDLRRAPPEPPLTHCWEPVIEGDVRRLLHRVVRIEGPRLPKGHAISLRPLGVGEQWAISVYMNSTGVFNGVGITKR